MLTSAPSLGSASPNASGQLWTFARKTLSFVTPRLQVDDLKNSSAREHVVVTAVALRESRVLQELCKADAGLPIAHELKPFAETPLAAKVEAT